MSWQQLVTPDTTVVAPPGWCLQAVQRSFRAGYSGPSATWAWEHAKGRHDGLPPAGISVPVFFAMKGEPAGHVVTWMPDGSLYSASDSDPQFDYHPNLQNLLDFYGGRLTLRGWSEYLGGTQIVKEEEVAEKIDQDVSRILAWGIMALNGVDGRPYALNGENGGDQFIGRPLDNNLIKDLYKGTTSTEWRDKQIPDINKRLAEGDGEFEEVTVYRKVK